MNEQEIDRITAEAANDEVFEQEQTIAAAMPPMPDSTGVAQEFAEFLDMGANALSYGLGVNVAARYTPAANMQIAEAAVKLCLKYGKDPRAYLLGGDSPLGVWLGFGLAVGMPGFMVYKDVKAKKAHELQEAANDSEQQQAA